MTIKDKKQGILTTSFDKLVAKFVSYYDGEIHNFVFDVNGKATTELSKSPKANTFLIVARHLYTESVKEYPIDSIKELKKVLKLEFANQANVRYHIWQIQDGKARVNIWKFHKSVPKTFCLLPESLIYAQSIKSRSNKGSTVITTQFSERAKKVFTSVLNQSVHSANNSAMIESAQQFAMASGIAKAEGSNEHLVDNIRNNTVSFIISGVKKLSPSIIWSFLKSAESINKIKVIQLTTIPLIVVLSIYMALASTYLSYSHYSLEQKLSMQSDNVSHALTLQNEIDEKKARYKALSTFASSQSNFSPVWLPILELFPDSKITHIQPSGERVVLRGNTKDAILLLEKLTEHSLVREAKFDFPTRKNRNRDVFVLSFTLNDNLFLDTKNDKEFVNEGSD